MQPKMRAVLWVIRHVLEGCCSPFGHWPNAGYHTKLSIEHHTALMKRLFLVYCSLPDLLPRAWPWGLFLAAGSV